MSVIVIIKAAVDPNLQPAISNSQLRSLFLILGRLLCLFFLCPRSNRGTR
jgi:hypothetical protein